MIKLRKGPLRAVRDFARETGAACYISLEERRRFVNTIFEIIAATGKDTLSSFQTDGLKAALEIINSYQKMKKEEKEHVRKILQQLFAAGADVLETGGNE